MSPWFDDPLERLCLNCGNVFEQWPDEPITYDLCGACRFLCCLTLRKQSDILGFLERELKENA
jgi:hypothetical protein